MRGIRTTRRLMPANIDQGISKEEENMYGITFLLIHVYLVAHLIPMLLNFIMYEG